MNIIARRFLSASLIVCLVLTSFMLMGSDDTYAAAKAKVKKVSFSKKKLDVTLNTQKTKLTITLKKKAKGAKCAYITLKNGKQKNVVFTKSVKGKKITASLTGDLTGNNSNYLSPGKWKVVKVVLKKGKSVKKWQPGHWSGSKWFSGFYYTSFKAGKTVASGSTKNKTTLTINAGSPTVTKVTARSSAEIGTTETFSAKVTNKNGVAVNSGKVIFKIKNGSSVSAPITATVNSSGIAQITYDIPKPQNEYSPYIFITGEYQGATGKYRRSSSTAILDLVTPTIELSEGEFYLSGDNYVVNLTLKNKNTGAPITGATIELSILKKIGSGSLLDLSHIERTPTEISPGVYHWVNDKKWAGDRNPNEYEARFNVYTSYNIDNEGYSISFTP